MSWCTRCGSTLTPNADGTCPACGAPPADQFRVRCLLCGWTERTLSVDETEQAKDRHRRWHPDAPPVPQRGCVAFEVDMLLEG